MEGRRVSNLKRSFFLLYFFYFFLNTKYAHVFNFIHVCSVCILQCYSWMAPCLYLFLSPVTDAGFYRWVQVLVIEELLLFLLLLFYMAAYANTEKLPQCFTGKAIIITPSLFQCFWELLQTTTQSAQSQPLRPVSLCKPCRERMTHSVLNHPLRN